MQTTFPEKKIVGKNVSYLHYLGPLFGFRLLVSSRILLPRSRSRGGHKALRVCLA